MAPCPVTFAKSAELRSCLQRAAWAIAASRWGAARLRSPNSSSGLRTHGSEDEEGRLRCELRRLQLRLRVDGANQVNEKPESDNRRPRDRQRDEAAITDQISAVERRVLLDPVPHG